MSADAKATFAVETRADTSETDELAASLERVHDRMIADQKAVADLNAGLRRLKGSSAVSTEEFKRMKDELTAKRASLAADQVQLVKLGGSLTDATRKVGDFKASRAAEGVAQKASAEAAKKATDERLAQLQKEQAENMKFYADRAAAADKQRAADAKAAEKRTADAKKAKKEFEDERERVNVLGEAMQGLAQFTAKAAVAVYAIAAAAAVAFVTFAVQAANAARSARLLREATTGSAAGAAQLEKQVGAIASRLPSTRAEVEEIGLALIRAGMSGAALDSALSAVATTAAVMGSTAGGIIQGIAERAKQSRRFILGAFDLKGTGLQIADVARALSARLKISFQAAMAAIQNGQVGMEAGLAALDDAVQKRFGKIGRAMALDLGKQLDKARENLGRLFKDVRIEPALAGLASILALLDENSATGAALKTIFETMLNPLLDGFAEAAPAIKMFFKGAIVGALMLVVELLTLRNELRNTFGGATVKLDLSSAFAMGAALVRVFASGVIAAARAVVGLIQLVVAIGTVISAAGSAIYGFGASVLSAIVGGVSAAWSFLSSINLSDVGQNIIKGLVSGIKAGAGLLVDAVKGLASTIVSTFTTSMVIRSPSRRMRPFGRQVPAGVAVGIEDGTDEVIEASEAMADAPVKAAARKGSSSSSSSTRGARGPVTVNVTIHGVQGAETLDKGSFFDRLVDAVERSARAGGALVEVTA